MAERGVQVDHSTIARWVLHFGPILNDLIRREMRRPNRSWRVDKTYVRVAGSWTYLYRAIDSAELSPKCHCRPSAYLNNIIEQDHRFVKKRITEARGSAQLTEH